MAQNVQTESTPRRGRGWLRALLIGLGLFIATTIVLVLTGNPNLYPTVILIVTVCPWVVGSLSG